MYKLCKTEQSARRQRELEEGLLAAMGTQRYEDISVSDLCEQMGIPRKAFYRYFDSKDGALHALLDHRLLEYELHTSAPTATEFLGFSLDLTYFFKFWLTQKVLLDALERNGLSGILVTRAVAHATEEQLLTSESRKYSEEYRQFATSFAVCGLMTAVIQWHHDGYRQSPKEMAEMTRRLMTSPLISEADLI